MSHSRRFATEAKSCANLDLVAAFLGGRFVIRMACRLFIDEVGNDDLYHPAERYLSLTGVFAKLVVCDKRITPQIESLKADFFDHNPPFKTVVLHRRELVRREPPFDVLRVPERNEEWEGRVLDLLDKLPYLVITVMIDKHEHRERYKVWHFDPYHYCMTALVERYVLWLNRQNLVGDVVVEPRFKRVDAALKRAFRYIYNSGTDNIPPKIVQARLRSKELKFEPKTSNVSGLQLVELIAHPSHHGTKSKYIGEEISATFGAKVYGILCDKKYCRNPKTFNVHGWGQKWLP